MEARAARIEALRALERAVENIRKYIEEGTIQDKIIDRSREGSSVQPPKTNITDEMKLGIDSAFRLIEPLIRIINITDTFFVYGRKIHIIHNIMEKISDAKEHNDINLITDEIKKMYAEMGDMIEIATIEDDMHSVGDSIDSLRQHTSRLYKLLTGDYIPPREKDFKMILAITEFMEKLVKIYDGFRTMTTKNHNDVLNENADGFITLYMKNNKGGNKSIESKKVYIDAFERVIEAKTPAYKQKAVSEFIKPLLNAWINHILLSEFSVNDAGKDIESQIVTLIQEIEIEYKNPTHYIGRLNEIRENISPKYNSLKQTIKTTSITIEQFETMFVKRFTFDRGFCRYLMRDTMELEAIEL